MREIAYWNRRLDRRFRRDSARLSEEIYRTIEYGTGLNFTKLLYDVLSRSVAQAIESQGNKIGINWGKVELGEVTAGYRCLMTDLVDHDPQLLVDAYQGLWRIQDGYRILPWEHGSLYERLSHSEFVESHFFISFLANYFELYLRMRMSWRHSPHDLHKALAGLVGHHLADDAYIFDFRNDVTDEIAQITGLDITRRVMTLSDISALMKQVM